MKNLIGLTLVAIALSWIGYELHFLNESNKLFISNSAPFIVINKETGKVYKLEKENVVESFEEVK